MNAQIEHVPSQCLAIPSEERKAELFKLVQFPGECSECPHWIHTDDQFGTGDSPADDSCEGSPGQCPQVVTALISEIQGSKKEVIQAYLDLSTSHITSQDAYLLELNDGMIPFRVVSHEYGFWVNVQPDLPSKIERTNFSKSFVQVYRYAIANKCNWINFDAAGPTVPFLTFNNW